MFWRTASKKGLNDGWELLAVGRGWDKNENGRLGGGLK